MTACSTGSPRSKATGRLLGGVGSIESCSGDVVSVDALTADEVGGDREHELTEYARALVPALPFKEIDVLIIERGGKDISGTTLDPNVTGRFWVPGLADAESPVVSAIVLLGITDISAGNVLGIGFADFIPASVANQIDFEKTYINCFTAGPAGMRRSRMPMVLPDEEACIKAALLDVRSWRRRAQTRRAHHVDAAPHPLLGERRAAVGPRAVAA